jgi:peptidoglycan/LPS O-acetylase OafA/YrhL
MVIRSPVHLRPIPVYRGHVSIYLLPLPVIMAVSYRAAQAGRALGMGYVAASFVATMVVLFSAGELVYRYIDAPLVKLARLPSRRG